MAVVKPQLATRVHKVVVVLFVYVMKGILRIKDSAKLHEHFLVRLISHVQALVGNLQPARLRQNRITRFNVLLFVGNLHWLMATQQRIVRGTE